MQVGALQHQRLRLRASRHPSTRVSSFKINTTSSLDITLQAGDIKETLTVIADAPTLQTDTSDMGTVVDKRQIMELPLALGGQGVLRAPEAFVFLTPGTTRSRKQRQQ
jgi:hypothetical protein